MAGGHGATASAEQAGGVPSRGRVTGRIGIADSKEVDHVWRTRFARVLLAIAVVVAVAVAIAAAAARPTAHRAVVHHGSQSLSWQDCGGGYQCASLRPRATTRSRTGRRSPWRSSGCRRRTEARIGALFVNFGGPGGTAVDAVQSFGGDLFWPSTTTSTSSVSIRAVSARSQPSVDCNVNQETDGIYAQPFVTPFNLDVNALVARTRRTSSGASSLNGSVLRYISTGNTARDMDRVRGGDGRREAELLRLLVRHVPGRDLCQPFPPQLPRDGARRPGRRDGVHRPSVAGLREQSQGFERALGSFFQACAANQATCGFGGSDPGRRVPPADRPGVRPSDPGGRARTTRGRWTATI